MAYDKVIPIRRRLDHCVSYVLNPEKTDLGRVLEYIGNAGKTIAPDGKAVLETAINCQLDTACRESAGYQTPLGQNRRFWAIIWCIPTPPAK